MSVISINGDSSIRQPTTIKEERMRKVHDSTSITGVIRRSWYADKWQVTVTFTGVSIADYNHIATYLYNQASPVTYFNAVTGVSFSGFVTAAIDNFIPGNSWLKNLSITIQER